MANLVITTVDTGSVAYGDVTCEDITLGFAATDTFVEGTLLARRATSADTYTGTITGTGTRVATLQARSGKSLKVGSYGIVAGTLASGVGAWTMTDPDGMTQSFTTVAAGGDLSFPLLDVDVVIADTGTNYVTADSVAFTVAAGTTFVPFDPAGENGVNVPVAVLAHESSRTDAGTMPARAIIAGTVRKQRLVIDVDGDGDNITAAHIEALRDFGVVALSVADNSVLDNS